MGKSRARFSLPCCMRRAWLLTEKALEALGGTSAGDRNVMPRFVEAAAARATLGEMVARLRHVFGEFREPLVL